MCQSTHASFVRHRRVDIDANVGFNVEQFAHPFVRIFYVNIAAVQMFISFSNAIPKMLMCYFYFVIDFIYKFPNV